MEIAPIDELKATLIGAIEKYKAEMLSTTDALTDIDQIAIARGMEVRGSYSVIDCARLTGISEWAIRKAIENGELTPTLPSTDSTHGMKIKSKELQRWFDAL